MDIFIEKLIKKRKSVQDRIFITGIMILGIIVGLILFMIAGSIGLLLAVGAIYGAYYVSSFKNIEYEYIFTNGDLDIDRITAQKRRKRLFSSNCKNFDIVARKDSDKFTEEIKGIKKHLELVSSMKSPDIYFATLNYKSERTLIFFEPDERMLASFKSIIPRKLFI